MEKRKINRFCEVAALVLALAALLTLIGTGLTERVHLGTWGGKTEAVAFLPILPVQGAALLLGGALHWWWAAPLAVLLPGLAVGVVESTQARNKLSRNATFLLTIAALAALIFFVALLLHLNIDIR